MMESVGRGGRVSMTGMLLILASALLLGWSAGAHAQAGAERPAAASSTSPGYRLGPDDGIQVIVFGQPEASFATRIKADGTIVMPFLGVVKVDGLTNIELARLLTDRLVAGDFLREPVVNVEVTQYVSKTVNVAGKVGQPGIVALDRPYRALEVLLKSGWVRGDGASYVYLRRAGQAERRLEVEALVRGGPEDDLLMQPGDTLFVPDADQYYLIGAINKPGAFPVVPGLTLQQAIAAAGGVSANGSMNKISVTHEGGKEESADPAQPVRRNDVYLIKERLF